MLMLTTCLARALEPSSPWHLTTSFCTTCASDCVLLPACLRDEELMNQHFVNIKVDREERPDVDKVYVSEGGVRREIRVWTCVRE